MAKIKRQVKTVDKWKKKKWFKVNAPKLFQEKDLGLTPTVDPELLLGRTVTTNLMTLTGNIKKQNTDITFVIDKIQGEVASTSIKKIILNPAYIKRRVRRNRDRIDDTLIFKTKDSVALKIKTMIITRTRSSKAIQTAIRSLFIDEAKKIIPETNYEEFMNNIIMGKFQREMKKTLSKIFPILDVELRYVESLKEGTYKLREKKFNVKTKVKDEEEAELEETKTEDVKEETKEEENAESEIELVKKPTEESEEEKEETSEDEEAEEKEE